MHMKKAIVVGATSGIGKEIAKILSQNNYIVGMVGRRINLLYEIQKELHNKTYVKRIDVSQTKEAMELLADLIMEMEGIDLIVINSGVGFLNPDLIWEREKEIIDVNVSGFVAMANVAFKHFCKQKSGHIVGISSIAALRGGDGDPAYSASKAFVSNFLQGLRKKISKLRLPITVTDIKPGFVDTPMAKGKRLFWVASPEKAALQICNVIKHKSKHAYITKRWRIIAWLLKFMPDSLYNRV